jgi:aspartyl-tRNA(Asn)/glutamyl-tRNA(Gln) amidotransferase subunit C
MKVSEKEVLYVANLANLELSGEEREHMVRDLNSILEYMDRLNEVDTTSVEPMAQVQAIDRLGTDGGRGGGDPFGYAAREDIREGLRKSLPHEVALQNAPESDGTFFKVPKVIER